MTAAARVEGERVVIAMRHAVGWVGSTSRKKGGAGELICFAVSAMETTRGYLAWQPAPHSGTGVPCTASVWLAAIRLTDHLCESCRARILRDGRLVFLSPALQLMRRTDYQPLPWSGSAKLSWQTATVCISISLGR